MAALRIGHARAAAGATVIVLAGISCATALADLTSRDGVQINAHGTDLSRPTTASQHQASDVTSSVTSTIGAVAGAARSDRTPRESKRSTEAQQGAPAASGRRSSPGVSLPLSLPAHTPRMIDRPRKAGIGPRRISDHARHGSEPVSGALETVGGTVDRVTRPVRPPHHRHPGGGRGHGKGSGEGPSGGGHGGGSTGETPTSRSGGSRVASQAGASAPSAFAPSGSSPQASLGLTPQVGAVTAQPVTVLGPQRRTRHGRSASRPRRSAALEGTGALASGALATSTAPAAPSGQARNLSQPVAAKLSGNPLEGIGRNIPLPIPVPDWSKPIITGLLLLALWFGTRSHVAALRARRLEGQRAVLLRDLGAMQAALVPEVPARMGGLAVSVAYRPAEGPAAGGDFYDVFVPAPGRVAVMLGDVAGHGHEALTHAALARYTLRAYLQAGLEPRTALALAGRVLVDPTGARYATVALAVYDEEAGTLTYSLAGHPPPMLVGFHSHEPLTVCSSPPVGWGIPTGRRQTTISLPAGAEACFFSDGLIEARRNGQLLGREHLREILTGLGREPQAKELLEQVSSASQAVPDDMVACLLAPESSGSAEGVHVEELEVDVRMLGRAGVSRFLRECSLSKSEISRATARAREIASASGTALLHVELGPAGAAVKVSAPRLMRTPSPSKQGRAPADQPLLAVLATS